MQLVPEKPTLVVLLGPTGSGKTDAAVELAGLFNGEIVSCDSRLFYRGMDIGTAKPDPGQMTLIKHHLIDIAEPDETLSLALFQSMSSDVIADIIQRGKLPFLVGGTGQYIRAVTEGWEPPEHQPDEKLRAVLEQVAISNGSDELFRYLALLDPPAAAVIDKRNIRRVVRALEVVFKSGRRFSEQRTRGIQPYHIIQFGIRWDRTLLFSRIDLRIGNMIRNGLIEEVMRLVSKGYSRDLPSMSAIGYFEICKYLEGDYTLEEAIMWMRRRTRQYVRRQANWFKPDDPQIHWINYGPGLITEMANIIKQEHQT